MSAVPAASLATKVSTIIDNLGLTQEEVGQIVDASARSIARWSAGEVVPQRLNKQRLLELAYVADAVTEVAPVVDPAAVETNIVILDLGGRPDVTGRPGTAADVVRGFADHGVRDYAIAPTRVRLVWHLDVDDAGTDLAIAAARAVFG